MRKYRYTIVCLILALSFFSCNEEEWLEEEVIDFYSADNSYETAAQFNSAVARLYNLTDLYTVWGGATSFFIFQYTSDVAYDAISPTHELNSYPDNLTPENVRVRTLWQRYYEIVTNANVIVGRIDGGNTQFDSEEQRNTLKAEALFLRAFIYKNLGITYGGVPLLLEELTEPKRDFVRASQEEVFAQCINDLEFAAANLPEVTELSEEGRLTKAAAYHLLTELYIITKDYDKAIESASKVIDNPNYALMTSRFGSKTDQPGDVYGDLFRRGNQNRSSGNTEGIWVAQYEYNVTAGGRGSILTQYFNPGYYNLVGTDGENLFLGPTNQHGGRGIGWFSPSDYLLNDVWENDPNDMRNSEYNIIRDLVADNTESAFYGQKIVENNAFTDDADPYHRYWNAIFAKTTPINDFPDEVFVDFETGEVTRNASQTFRDHYHMRLAETYLLRAEAYLGKGNLGLAADDINRVRARSNAAPVEAGDVDIDYILDERTRELHMEEYRMQTLMRLGLMDERKARFNPFYNGKYENYSVEEYHNFWPIPQQEIERNTEATLEQNPGYN
ncbi:RagB/SusD family nutrient uptake outer membrane protein [Zobellia uliginosa]|uniref:RagB/SusD family nutrient uptake outer membrane protein n=1 Tax=Zobellia uliginosa TaxID=143224 RepID=UPI0026E47804|nr:RagB/SusD family nutrient uptake outer membrane protein [Zobellia uliginosa]MDO6518704.1 RagB/SusD family nutrient uptake outer membrane protein [Zobellia uliginosa]